MTFSLMLTMFCQPSDSQNDGKQIIKNLPSKNNQAKRKQKKKQKKKVLKNKLKSKLSLDMSTWAENFTIAATWQLKHQVAYWKARANALEYENSVLHDVIRRNHHKLDFRTHMIPTHQTDSVETPSEEYCESESEEDTFEVSEQYIQFLADNAKFKEDARHERERLKAKQTEETEINMEEKHRETIEENRERLTELYGEKWQRISALETNILSKFINEYDKSKPTYWPNIPFNFNCS